MTSQPAPNPKAATRQASPDRSVLIIDESSEAREVLRTALQRRGLRVLDTGHAQRGLDLVRSHQPDLVVLDLESVPSEQAARATEAWQQEASSNDTPIVLLGSATGRKNWHGGEFIAKPYHYAPLIRRIQELLDQ